LESRLAQTYDTSRLIDNNFKMYLLISNDTNQEETFCLSVQQPQQTSEHLVLPTDTFLIQSQATYANQQVVLDASYAQPIPGFLFSTYTSF
jgi:alanine-alpha-ketoisovalerate/valine-pyruvate aminotransferase